MRPLGKTVLCHYPLAILEELDNIALSEHRNRSELLREIARKFVFDFKKTQGYLTVPTENLPATE
jgi:metal-responsive CopG/Arc/MetJ family transcriptional regulator